MEWMTAIRECIRYMEDNIMTVSGPAEVAAHVNMSEMYLQRGFQVVTGLTLGEYVRNRRLYMAAMDLANTNDKIIDIAYKYGYDTPESFTKAFGRFHDATPTQIRRDERDARTFLPMRISMVVEGGDSVDVHVDRLDTFKLIGEVKEMTFETHLEKIPVYWDEFGKKYGDMINTEFPARDLNAYEQALYDNRVSSYDAYTTLGTNGDRCRFMIAGMYKGGDVPDGLEVWTIPGSLWAKFFCEGPLPAAGYSIKKYIWFKWLPGNIDYELYGDYYITKYSPKMDTKDIHYKCEMWMPVRERR
ncbi:MAG: AraC family transcriptional regulator [Lachnospiraceae bacterium]|nr:AraC family transcriptional regulator [Lachnospiraceae bacterium]MBR6485432.1 AraC family transcriptional regulator [Lachnospiraceae bacterium]